MNKNIEKTILVDKPINQNIDCKNPLFYYKQKNYFLQELSDKVSLQHRLPTIDLKKNVRINYYLDQYKHKKAIVEQQIAAQQTYLKTKQFNTIFNTEETEVQKLQKQKKQAQFLQNKLYQAYIEQINNHQQPEHDKSDQPCQPLTILKDYRSDPERLREMYLLDLQIGKLKKQQQIERAVVKKHNSCKNNQLVGKLSNHIISAYMVYFDEIYDSLIDEILEQQVIYFNHLQAQFKLNRKQQPFSANPYGNNINTLRMIQLVKSLDDLCD